MKTCPHCGSLAFDDLDTCYGCMYRFGISAPVQDCPASRERGTCGGAGSDDPAGLEDSRQGVGIRGEPPHDSGRVPGGVGAASVLDSREWERFENRLQHEYERFEQKGGGASVAGMVDPGAASEPVAILSCRTQGGEEARYPLRRGGSLDIGRSSRCDVVLSAPSVSRMHARVEANSDGIWLEDLGSSNHTYVQGAAISGRVQLRVGDGFLICGSYLRVESPGTGDDPMERNMASTLPH